jgi:hypothetical protein
MPLILRTTNKYMGWEDAKDDYVVLEGEGSIGRIHKDDIHHDHRWGGEKVVMSEHRLKALQVPCLSMWIGGSIDVKLADDCLDVLKAAFQSPRWKQLPRQERIRLVGSRLSHIMEIAEKRDLAE